MSEERIGKYRVHPVASMFPLLEGQDYEDLRRSIETLGQLHPVIVQSEVLFDGRNRLRVCLDLGREPIITEYTGSLNPEDFISTVNLHRRHIDADMRTAITTQIHAWKIAQQNAETKLTGKSADGEAGGRGHKRNLHTNRYEGLSKRDARAENACSTAGQIANAAKVSHRKAAQAIFVHKQAPDLIKQVANGQIKLHHAEEEAHKRKAIHQSAKRSAGRPKNFLREQMETGFEFLRTLRAEIKRRRKEVNAPRAKGYWNPDPISKLELTQILDWIEDELAKIPGQSANSCR